MHSRPAGAEGNLDQTQAVYYPLVLTTFWVLHKFVGLNPLPYHILNVLLHAGSAVLLWRLLRQLEVRGAWLGAALWALHPVMVQSVAWVTELKNTQSCVFYLLSIFFFLKWEDQAAARLSTVPAGDYGPPFLGYRFISAFLSARDFKQTSMVMLPIVLALCIWWRRERIQRRDFLALAPFPFISAFASIWTIWEQKFHAGAIGGDWAQTWPERLIIAGTSHMVLPGQTGLAASADLHLSDGGRLIRRNGCVSAVAGSEAGLDRCGLSTRNAGRALFFAAAYYVVSLFPVLGFFSVYFFRYSFVSDHFQYLASMGPLA